MADVTKDVALLPLPEKWTAYACMPQYEIMDLLHDYARANVEAATEALRKRCEAVEAALPALRAEVRALKENPNRGDMVFRCGFNGAIDCVVGRIDQAIAAAQEPSHG